MEYQKIANLLESTSDNLSKFRTRNWVEINDESRGNYANSDIRFKTTMLRSDLCDYADSYILKKGTITITGAGDDAAARRADERNKGVTFKNCAPFTKWISRINNTDIDNAHDIDIIMPMYNLLGCSDNYSKTILTWSKDCVITNSTGERKFAITETKLYVSVATLSTKDNEKLLQQLKSGFKKTISWNKYESSIKTFAQNRYLNYLINPSFQGANRLFALAFENENGRTSYSTYYLPKVEIKDYNVMIDGRNFLINQ